MLTWRKRLQEKKEIKEYNNKYNMNNNRAEQMKEWMSCVGMDRGNESSMQG